MNKPQNTQSNKLGLSSLTFNTIGISLGGAIVSYLGFAIGLGGRSTIITVIICLVCGFILALPFYLLSKLAIVKGSMYSIVMENLGPKAGGITQYLFLTDILVYSTYPLTISAYLEFIFPSINRMAVAIGIVLLVYLILITGLEMFAKFQNFFTIVLVISLTLFSIIGVHYLISNNINPFNFSDPNYFYKGIDGITLGIPLLIFYTYLYCYILFYGPISQRPTKNIPKAMIIGGSFMIAAWFFVTLVAANVLPIEQVANQPLTLVADEIMPKSLALFFVIGGAIMAILTSYLGLVPVTTIGILQTAKEGWFPKVFRKQTKKGTPIVIYSVIQGAILILVVSEIPINTLLYQIALIVAVGTLLLYVAMFRIPVKHPELFDRVGGKITKRLFRVVSTLGIVLACVIFYYSVQGISITQVLVNLGFLVILSFLAHYLVKSGRIESESNFELDVSIDTLKDDCKPELEQKTQMPG